MFRILCVLYFVNIFSLLNCVNNDFLIQKHKSVLDDKSAVSDSVRNEDKIPVMQLYEKPPVLTIGEKPLHSPGPTTNYKENNQMLAALSSTTKNVTKTTTTKPIVKIKVTEMESGAVVRGLLVLMAFSVLFLLYLGIKTYRKRTNKSVMVRKYGVRTPRNDVEMTPLPLDEDEEDETLFDVGSVNRL